MLHLEQFLVRVYINSPAQAEAFKFLKQGNGEYTEERKLAHAVRLRDCGTPVFRLPGVNLGMLHSQSQRGESTFPTKFPTGIVHAKEKRFNGSRR